MKWYINLIALCVALTTASPAGNNIGFPANHRATFALDERGGCSNDDTECCCLCAEAGA